MCYGRSNYNIMHCDLYNRKLLLQCYSKSVYTLATVSNQPLLNAIVDAGSCCPHQGTIIIGVGTWGHQGHRDPQRKF